MHNGFVQNASLLPHTTYHIGGKAKFLARVSNLDELLRAMELSENRLILGKGSKVLVSDDGFDGVVVLMRIMGVRFNLDGGCLSPLLSDNPNQDSLDEGSLPPCTVYAGAGVSLPVLSRIYASKGLGGLEWACGIPASIGGALKLNAGAYGGDMSQVVSYADVLREGRIIRLSADECGFAYRSSGFYPSDVILGAELKVRRGDRSEICRLRTLYGEKRIAAQPSGFCCGSVFKAGQMPAYSYIQQCGLKGMAIGNAEISKKHANFILNRGSARAMDVYNLIRTVKAEVFVGQGVRLKEEVIYVGEF